MGVHISPMTRRQERNSRVGLRARALLVSTAFLLWAPRGASAAPIQPDSAFAAQVRQEIATAWRVEPARVHLSWGYIPPEMTRPARLTRLLGRGLNGWFAVVCRTSENTSQCLRLRAGALDQRSEEHTS